MDDNALELKKPNGLEEASTALASKAEAEVQARVLVAKRFPRDYNEAWRRISRSCKTQTLATRARFSYPRKKKGGGTTTITGGTIHLMTTIAAGWGNIEYGAAIISVSPDHVVVRGSAWDMETNVLYHRDAVIKKTQQRSKGGETTWVDAGERDWQEIVANRASRLTRVALEKVIPRDIIDDALLLCDRTVAEGDSKDPDGTRRAIVENFDNLGIEATTLELIIGCELRRATKEQIAELRGMHHALKDGEATIKDYLPRATPDEMEQLIDGKIAEGRKAGGKPALTPGDFDEDQLWLLGKYLKGCLGLAPEDKESWLAAYKGTKGALLAEAEKWRDAEESKTAAAAGESKTPPAGSKAGAAPNQQGEMGW